MKFWIILVNLFAEFLWLWPFPFLHELQCFILSAFLKIIFDCDVLLIVSTFWCSHQWPCPEDTVFVHGMVLTASPWDDEEMVTWYALPRQINPLLPVIYFELQNYEADPQQYHSALCEWGQSKYTVNHR